MLKMVSENAQREILVNQSQFNVSPLNIVATLCLFSGVFLGLKLRWFRAKIQFGDIRSKKKDKDTVQGIGIKLNTNVEMRQVYKSTSEFTTVDVTPIRNEGYLQSENIRTARDHVNRILQNSKINPANSGSPVSLSKHKRTEPIINDFIYDVPPQHNKQTLQIKNPLAVARNIEEERKELQLRLNNVVPAQNIQKKDEEVSLEYEDDFPYTNLRFQNINNEKQSGMYSNQAANIFFGSTEDDSSTISPPTPTPRKFLEDIDNISENGRTYA